MAANVHREKLYDENPSRKNYGAKVCRGKFWGRRFIGENFETKIPPGKIMKVHRGK